jgi:hypothetical protein
VGPRFTHWNVAGLPIRIDEKHPALFDEALDLPGPPRLVPAGDAKRTGVQVSEAEFWALVSAARGRHRPDVNGSKYSFWVYGQYLPIRYDPATGSAEAFHRFPPVPAFCRVRWPRLVRVSEAEFWALTCFVRGRKLWHSIGEYEEGVEAG